MADGFVVGTRTRYRKRPLLVALVDAVLWEGNPDVFNPWMKAYGSLPIALLPIPEVTITTAAGETLLAKIGEWIIRGAEGQVYTCTAEAFAETYERVEVELLAPPEMVSKLFSGELDPMLAGDVAVMYPPVERIVESEGLGGFDPFVDEASRVKASRLLTLADQARRLGYRFVCVECGHGANDRESGVHFAGCPLDVPAEAVTLPGWPPICESCGTPMWVSSTDRGCPTPRCREYKPMPRPLDGSPGPA